MCQFKKLNLVDLKKIWLKIYIKEITHKENFWHIQRKYNLVKVSFSSPSVINLQQKVHINVERWDQLAFIINNKHQRVTARSIGSEDKDPVRAKSAVEGDVECGYNIPIVVESEGSLEFLSWEVVCGK